MYSYFRHSIQAYKQNVFRRFVIELYLLVFRTFFVFNHIPLRLLVVFYFWKISATNNIFLFLFFVDIFHFSICNCFGMLKQNDCIRRFGLRTFCHSWKTTQFCNSALELNISSVFLFRHICGFWFTWRRLAFEWQAWVCTVRLIIFLYPLRYLFTSFYILVGPRLHHRRRHRRPRLLGSARSHLNLQSQHRRLSSLAGSGQDRSSCRRSSRGQSSPRRCSCGTRCPCRPHCSYCSNREDCPCCGCPACSSSLGDALYYIYVPCIFFLFIH